MDWFRYFQQNISSRFLFFTGYSSINKPTWFVSWEKHYDTYFHTLKRREMMLFIFMAGALFIVGIFQS